MRQIKIGDKIKIITMEGEPHYKDREGVVTHIDDAGQIHGTWGFRYAFRVNGKQKDISVTVHSLLLLITFCPIIANSIVATI